MVTAVKARYGLKVSGQRCGGDSEEKVCGDGDTEGAAIRGGEDGKDRRVHMNHG